MKLSSKIATFSSIVVGVFLFGSTTFAATPKEITEPSTIQVNDSQLVQVLPEGGFIYNSDGSSTFDSGMVEQNNSSLMTYQEYKNLPSQNSSISGTELFRPMLRAASPHGQTGKVLARNETYVSDTFSGSGWRFSNLKFIAANGTGTWLRWTSINDGGRVGHYDAALDTYQGRSIRGTALQTGQSKYVDTQGDWLYYFTYNPVNGTKYMVENK